MQIPAITGHKSLALVNHYAAARDQALLAEAAMKTRADATVAAAYHRRAILLAKALQASRRFRQKFALAALAEEGRRK